MTLRDRLTACGVWAYLSDVRDTGTAIHATADLAVIEVLRACPDVQEGIFHLLHANDVRGPRVEFRSFRHAIGRGSVQMVIGTESGDFYADVDRFNTQDVVNIVGHFFGEVVPGIFRRRKPTAEG